MLTRFEPPSQALPFTFGPPDKFAELGARYVSLAHNGHSQLSDSNTGERDNDEYQVALPAPGAAGAARAGRSAKNVPKGNE